MGLWRELLRRRDMKATKKVSILWKLIYWRCNCTGNNRIGFLDWGFSFRIRCSNLEFCMQPFGFAEWRRKVKIENLLSIVHASVLGIWLRNIRKRKRNIATWSNWLIEDEIIVTKVELDVFLGLVFFLWSWLRSSNSVCCTLVLQYLSCIFKERQISQVFDWKLWRRDFTIYNNILYFEALIKRLPYWFRFSASGGIHWIWNFQISYYSSNNQLFVEGFDGN